MNREYLNLLDFVLEERGKEVHGSSGAGRVFGRRRFVGDGRRDPRPVRLQDVPGNRTAPRHIRQPEVVSRSSRQAENRDGVACHET